MKKNSTLSWLCTALALTGFAAGCADEAVDIGDDEAPAVLGESLSDYAGTWSGYAELAEWDDGTDTVRLQLDENGDGVLELGDADPLPPPVANESYPPGLSETEASILGHAPMLATGFSYPITGAIVESQRIRLGTRMSALYDEWCGFFTPVPVEGGEHYSCIANTTLSVDEDGCFAGDPPDQEPIDCDIIACQHLCRCDETSCTGSNGSNDIRLDAKLEMNGKQMEGSFAAYLGTFTVHMTRED